MGSVTESVMQAVDFIEDNLKNNLSVLDVSNRACYSVYHFIRMFEGITGHTPKDYILRRRICEAAADLSEKESKIIDIAYDYQFGSPEVFSRAFKRITGLTPSEYQKEKPVGHSGLLTKLTRDTVKYAEKARETTVEIVELESIHLAGMATFIRKDKSIIDEIWRYMYYELKNIPDNILKNIDKYYGHSYWSNDYDLDGFFLLCSIPLKEQIGLDSPFCYRSIPASRYLRFIHKGNIHDISLTYKYIFETYLPKTDFVLSKPYDFEIYYNNSVAPTHHDARTEILLPIESM